MSSLKIYHVLTALLWILCSCAGSRITEKSSVTEIRLVDSLATIETYNLFTNLKSLSEYKIIFGHQDATAYGVNWKGDPNRSDVKDVTGSHPGVYGWDFAGVTTSNGQFRDYEIHKLVTEAYDRGGVNTFSWHYANPVTGESFYDTTKAVKHILPGGMKHNKYKSDLKRIAEFAESLTGSDGSKVPVIFRPFHEFDGSWFWWGDDYCSREEFVSLWRFTVDYLKDSLDVHNFLYAFSPDRLFYSREDYLLKYPGDNYVDILGMDNYYDFTPMGDGLEWLTDKLRIISELTEEKNKVAAFTETGSEGIKDSTWWTNKLLKVIEDPGVNIAYVLVWRNAHNNHFYAPFPGHKSADDFILFKYNPLILFEDDLPNLYKSPI
jgi:mannan endo-1,4-beta-mannosidase